MKTTWLGHARKSALAAVAALALASAAFAQSVVVYSAVSPKVMTAFVEEFQKQNPGIKVDLISGGSGELLTRLNAEKARPRADVLVGPDADNFDAYLDLFESYKSTEDAAFPRSAVGPDNKYYGFSTNFQAFIVNTKMMPADKAPQTWSDLAKPEYKGKVVMANPAQSGSAFSQMQQILQLYNWDMMDKIIGTATFVTSSRLAYQNVAKGEVPVGLTSEFNIVASQAEGFPVVAIYPEGRHRAHQRRERHRQGRAKSGQREEVPRLRQFEAGAPDDRRHRQAAQRAQRRRAAGRACPTPRR